MAQKLDGPPRFTSSDFSLWRFQFTLWLCIKDLEGVLEGSERRPGADEAEASAGVSIQEGAGAGGASSSSLSEGSGGGSAAPRTGRHRLIAEELLKAQEAWDRKEKQAFQALEELNYKVDEKEIIYTALQGLDQEANEALLQYLHLEQQKWTKAWIWEVLVSDEARKRDAGRGVEGGMGAGDRAVSKKYQQRQGGGGKKKELDKCLVPGCNRKHSWKECWSRPDGWKPQGKEKAAAAAANEDKKGKEDSLNDGFSFLSLEKETALAGRVLADPNQLILDSGATCGMVPRRDLFTTYHSLPPNSRNVIVGSGDTLQAIDIGTITVKGKEGEVLNLKGMLHVPGLAANLLSCSQLARQEYICTFTMGGCTVRKGGAVVMEAKLEKGLYLVPVCVPHVEKAHGVEAKDAACSTRWRDVEQVTADLLHLRMGHARRQQLVECVKKGELKGVEIKEGGGQPSKCPDCMTGKLPRTSFPTSTTRASAPLELVHTDVCGPMQTPEREKGSKYFITFLDDFSRLSWVTLVKTKDEFDEALMDFGFERSECDPALYHLVRDEGRLSLYLYVDDILLLSSSMVLLDEVKGLLSSRFRMKDLGEAKYYLGVQIERDESGILTHQERYILNMLESFGLSEANPVRTPLPTGFDVHAHAQEPLLRDELVLLYQSIVGSLMYASTTTQPQIAYAVSQLSKVVSCLKAFHLQDAKRVLRHLKGCVKSGIFYPSHSKPQVELVGFSDADYAGDSADRKSHTGYVYCLNGAAISWQSKRQPVVALSTTESEYISLCQCIQEGVWLKRLFGEFGQDLAGGVPVFVDNQSAIALAQNACLHGRTKHMQVRWHFIREMVASGEVILRWCPTNRQAADILTKPLPFERHGVCMSLMGMQPHVGMVPEQDVRGLVLLCLDDIMLWTAPLPGQGGVE
ncbi:unnamed protein product [Closterium sp. NIES-54]